MLVTDGISPTVVGSGEATAPAAGSTIATIPAASLPAGKYRVKVISAVSNNVSADRNNMEFQVGGVDYVTPLVHGCNGQPGETELSYLVLDGTQALDVKNIGVGTAAVEYAATLLATRLG
jgi:hypothetical protein